MGNLLQRNTRKNTVSSNEKKVEDDFQLDSNSIEKPKAQTMQNKHEAQLCNELISKDYGDYTEIDEKDFVPACITSPEMVVHFYTRGVPRCEIFDYHLKILAGKHLEVKFFKINAEHAPILTERLEIKEIPTLLIVIDGKTKAFIAFSDLGECDEFPTEALEWRLGTTGIIKYEEDYGKPANKIKTSPTNQIPERTVRFYIGENESSYESIPEIPVQVHIGENESSYESIPERPVQIYIGENESSDESTPERPVRFYIGENASSDESIPERPVQVHIGENASSDESIPEIPVQVHIGENESSDESIPEIPVQVHIGENESSDESIPEIPVRYYYYGGN